MDFKTMWEHLRAEVLATAQVEPRSAYVNVLRHMLYEEHEQLGLPQPFESGALDVPKLLALAATPPYEPDSDTGA